LFSGDSNSNLARRALNRDGWPSRGKLYFFPVPSTVLMEVFVDGKFEGEPESQKSVDQPFHVLTQQCARLNRFAKKLNACACCVTPPPAARCRLKTPYPASHNPSGPFHMHLILILQSGSRAPIVSPLPNLATG